MFYDLFRQEAPNNVKSDLHTAQITTEPDPNDPTAFHTDIEVSPDTMDWFINNMDKLHPRDYVKNWVENGLDAGKVTSWTDGNRMLLTEAKLYGFI